MIKIIKRLILFITILFIIFIKAYIVPLRVNGSSMEPTLQNNQKLLLNKMNKSYYRFSIVVFNHNNKKLIKRIVGMPGDKVEYKDDHLYINDEFIYENFEHTYTDDFTCEYIIPEGHYFVIGDNRSNSLDSRRLGPISKNQIDGIVTLSMFPLRNISKHSIE